MAFQCGHLEAHDVLAEVDDVELICLEAEPGFRRTQHVRSKEEVLRTLDQRGQVEGLPFMPEMFQFCGRRFQVVKRAHKTCDPPSGLQARRMANAVHLTGIRCDGEAHGGVSGRLSDLLERGLAQADRQRRASVATPGIV